MDRSHPRCPAVLALLALLWLAPGPAVAAPALLAPSAPEESLLATLWSWITDFRTAAGPEPSFEKSATGGDPDSGIAMPDEPVIDKGILIDPNGQR